ncbi:hypothetical protein RRU01S_31_00620 [Agrobacterium rubi TR3 = NBRC 13261]|uniref:Uncharacterized protein n=1 Tax=Agrobacterium rubi TR3 = NBRC 13261 TaxID=1368415 RepID=A0A081D2I2_9HYPH|nr:hypothetical protein [Agrobacterium rubi]MBP1881343.1 DNA-binding transcriptional ArsR family regulator [Agrobacterium rubi]GAK73128.1 hypothetical protein RRU01S_31_00620 [Agrobacterium rubi TR3 = NBRC 13261]
MINKSYRYQDWIKLPTAWIEKGGLMTFKWAAGEGADNTAALLVLLAVAHRIDETGTAKITYDEIELATSMSRAKVAAGLSVLVNFHLIEKEPAGQSTYRLANFDPDAGWAKLPCKRLYNKGVMLAFSDFKLRRPIELHALKLYFLFASRRDRRMNMAMINYNSIGEYTGLQRNHVRDGLSLLTVHGLIHVDRVPSFESDMGKANAYRLTGLDSYVHRGTVDIAEITSEHL